MAMSKVLGEIDEYVDNLDEDLRDIAKRELREDDEIRDHSLQALRDWILKNPDIIKCRLDSSFLLRFLRVRKYSIPSTQEILMKYITTRMVLADVFTNLDCLDPSVKPMFDNGVICMLKGRKDDGRRVMYVRYAQLGVTTIDTATFIRASTIALETLIAQHDNQIAGLTYILDYKDIGLNFVAMWSPTFMQKMMTGLAKAFPMRHRDLQCINLHPKFNAFMQFFMKFAGDKLKQRFILHDSGVKLEDLVPKRMLPKEHGGSECTMQEMIDSWKDELLEYREQLLQLDELVTSEDCKSKRTNEIFPDHDLGCDGSFRQLQID